jgi:hypothetical protein
MQPQFIWRRISSTGFNPPDESLLERAWNTFKNGLDILVDAITTFTNALLDTFGSLLGPFLDLIAGLVRLLFAIPYLGGILGTIWNGILTLAWGVASIVDFILALLGILPEKRMKMRVVIQFDDAGNTTTTVAEALPLVQAAINTFKDQANVRILPLGYFKYASAFQDTPTAADAYFMTEDAASSSTTLDVCCDLCAFGHSLTTTGPSFQYKMIRDCFEGNASSLIGYGSPVCAFAVRQVEGGKWGCSLPIPADYVTVDFKGAANNGSRGAILTLAHELAHACNLTHGEHWFDSQADGNLMNEDPSLREPTLTRVQVAFLRTSRHVTYFDLPF